MTMARLVNLKTKLFFALLFTLLCLQTKLEAKDFRHQSFDNQNLIEIYEFNFNETLFALAGKTIKLWLTDNTIEKGILKSVNSESLALLKDGSEHQVLLSQITKVKRKNRVGKIVGIILKVITIPIIVVAGILFLDTAFEKDYNPNGILGDIRLHSFLTAGAATLVYYGGKKLHNKSKKVKKKIKKTPLQQEN